MAKAPKLNDLQLLLLSTAIRRKHGNLLPLPESIAGSASRPERALESLIKRGFVAEADVACSVPSWREEGDRRIGAFITAEGKSAIEAEDATAGGKQRDPATPPPPPAAVTPPNPGGIKAGTKQALLVELLELPHGASIQQIVDATGWLPHTTRAALTGLKKRGFEISIEKLEGVSHYRAKRPA